MSQWATIVLTLGSALIGVLGALAGTLIQMRSANHQRRATERRARREQGAEAVAPVMALLDDANPTRLFLPGRDPAALIEQIEELERRWKPLRDRLLVYGASHPSGDVVGSAQTAVGSIQAFLLDLRSVATGGSGCTPQGAQEIYTSVLLIVIELLAKVRGENLYLGPARDLKTD
jgi:hypothetical protein